jgi:hypothetical protein
LKEISDVTFHFRRFKTLLIGALATIAASAVYADDAPTPAPTPAAIETAKTIVASSGMTRSFDLVIPEIFGALERNVLATRPELKEPLHTVLISLVPEFVKTKQQVVDVAALALAKRMNEQELKDTATFLNSASGKKYVEAQPQALNEIFGALNDWRQKLSVDVLTRTREELKKKGFTL